jgi:hypothetical protein
MRRSEIRRGKWCEGISSVPFPYFYACCHPFDNFIKRSCGVSDSIVLIVSKSPTEVRAILDLLLKATQLNILDCQSKVLLS